MHPSGISNVCKYIYKNLIRRITPHYFFLTHKGSDTRFGLNFAINPKLRIQLCLATTGHHTHAKMWKCPPKTLKITQTQKNIAKFKQAQQLHVWKKSVHLHHYLFNLFKNLTTMAHVITDACIACGTCMSACPVDAITEGDIYHIDPDKCIDCGSCAASCPNDAITEG